MSKDGTKNPNTKEPEMKVMMTWKLHPQTRHETLAKFTAMKPKDEKALMGPDVKLIGRWHDLIGGTGVAIFEARSADAVSAYALAWNGVMDLVSAIVLDDEETRAVGRNFGG